LGERVRVNRRSVLLAEHEIPILVVRAPLVPIELLSLLVCPKSVDGPLIKVDQACMVVLGCRGDDLAGDRYERLTNGDPCVVEVDILPSKTEDFAAAHAGHSSNVPRSFETMTLDGPEERFELMRLPKGDLGRQPGPWPWWLRSLSDVRSDEAGIDGVGEGLVDDRVDVPDGLGGRHGEVWFYAQSRMVASL